MQLQIDSGVSGLIGVLVGSSLAFAKDWFLQARKDRRDIVLSTYRIATQLERFSGDCANVAGHSGDWNEDGEVEISISAPKLNLDELDVEWKILDEELLFRILDLPYKKVIADGLISETFEHDGPPDYQDGFETRQYEYAGLGIEAAEIAKNLRRNAKLKALVIGQWDPQQYMKDERKKIEDRKMRRLKKAEQEML